MFLNSVDVLIIVGTSIYIISLSRVFLLQLLNYLLSNIETDDFTTIYIWTCKSNKRTPCCSICNLLILLTVHFTSMKTNIDYSSDIIYIFNNGLWVYIYIYTCVPYKLSVRLKTAWTVMWLCTSDIFSKTLGFSFILYSKMGFISSF